MRGRTKAQRQPLLARRGPNVQGLAQYQAIYRIIPGHPTKALCLRRRLVTYTAEEGGRGGCGQMREFFWPGTTNLSRGRLRCTSRCAVCYIWVIAPSGGCRKESIDVRLHRISLCIESVLLVALRASSSPLPLHFCRAVEIASCSGGQPFAFQRLALLLSLPPPAPSFISHPPLVSPSLASRPSSSIYDEAGGRRRR